MNLGLRLISIRIFFPAIYFVEKYLCYSAGNRTFAFDLLMEDLVIECAENLIFKSANEREIRLRHNVARDQHCEEVVMLYFY